MGSERASTVRQKHSGQICALCNKRLPPPHIPGEHLCSACLTQRKHRVYMSFMLREGWHCVFLEADCKTSLPRKLNFKDERKIFEIAERVASGPNLETRQALEHGIEIGRGGVWLELTGGQYKKLFETRKAGTR
jgi:hypothetical protein